MGQDNGFALAEVDPKVKEWAQEIQQRKDQATAQQKALAELALKHYGVAAELFGRAADEIGASMDEDEKKFLEERRTKMRELVGTSIQSAKAYQLDRKYNQATQILEKARDRAAGEHSRFSEDAALRAIWLDTTRRTAVARVEQGEVATGSDSAPLIAHSIEDYRSLLHEYSGPDQRGSWATTQANLGVALMDQGQLNVGAQAADAFAQAVVAFQAALTVRTKAGMPEDWASAQVGLGNALLHRGERIVGAQSAEFFAQAVEAYGRRTGGSDKNGHAPGMGQGAEESGRSAMEPR